MGMENPNLSTPINIIMVHFFLVQKCQSKLTICHDGSFIVLFLKIRVINLLIFLLYFYLLMFLLII